MQETGDAMKTRLAILLARHVKASDADLMDREFVWEVVKRFMDGLQEPIAGRLV
jgi:hypothetical protein